MNTTDKITRLEQLQSVTVHAKEWFDRANGNSYFSCRVILNDGLPDAETIKLPFQYGYGNSSEYAAMQAIAARFPRTKWDNRPLWQLRDRKIPFSYFKQEQCTRKECEKFAS